VYQISQFGYDKKIINRAVCFNKGPINTPNGKTSLWKTAKKELVAIGHVAIPFLLGTTDRGNAACHRRIFYPTTFDLRFLKKKPFPTVCSRAEVLDFLSLSSGLKLGNPSGFWFFQLCDIATMMIVIQKRN
jgi:hypothetical protein